VNLSASIRDLLNLQDLVTEHRAASEVSWEGEQDHEVHLWRSAYTVSVAGRSADIDQSMRMNGAEFTMFTNRRCMWQVDTSSHAPMGGLCGEDVASPDEGFNHRHVYCHEHVQDAADYEI
jgi:hypothetical protein